METLIQDIRYALRTLSKNPRFTVVAVLTLALGIGATVSIFSVVNEVLLAPLPYREPGRLVMLWQSRPAGGPDDFFPVRPADFADLKQQSRVFEELAYSRDGSFSLTGMGDPESIIGYRFSANFFSLLGTQPILGRTFLPEEDRPGGPLVTVLSHRLWQRKFGGDPKVVGKTVQLNGRSYTIIGVMPPEFRHPMTVELWVPIAFSDELWQRRDATVLRVVGRLKPGVSLEDAQGEVSAIAQRLEKLYPQTNSGISMTLRTLRSMYTGDISPALITLLAAVGFMLLIACVNIANLLLARATGRSKELSIRAALGAERKRIIRQLLTESMVLAFIGGGLGLLLAYASVDFLLAIFPNEIANLSIPKVEQIPIDARVLGFTFLATLVTALLFGALPAIAASRTDVNESLKLAGRGAVGGQHRVQSGLVVLEIAVALVLLVCAGLLIRSFQRVQQASLGFDEHRTFAAAVMLSGNKYDSPEKWRLFTEQVLARLQSVPGVETAGVTNYLPLSGWWGILTFAVEGQPLPRPGEEYEADNRTASPSYFRSMGTPILQGRDFDDRDRDGSTKVVILNQTAARRFFGGRDPIGQRIDIGYPDPPNMQEVVGVVADMRNFGLEEDVHPEVYRPVAQAPMPILAFTLRTSQPPASLAEPVRRAIWAVDKDQPIAKLLPLSELAGQSIALRRISTLLMGAFAALALLLAAVGTYGVIAYSVADRTREIGIRVALGARPADVVRGVLRQGLVLTAIGLAAGILGAIAATRLLGTLLYGIKPTDTLTYFAVAAALFTVALLASYIPARRAARVDPMVALRYE